MCGTCTTLLDVAGTNAALVGVVAANRWERFKDRRAGRARLERDLRNWEANAAFMRELGLDPLTTLGAPPTVPDDDSCDIARPTPEPLPIGT